MARAALTAILTMTAVSTLSGCGAVANYYAAETHDPSAEQKVGKIYGGIQMQLEEAQSLIAGPPSEAVEYPYVAAVFQVCALALDMPLTLVGDTLMLPYTIHYTLQCQAMADK